MGKPGFPIPLPVGAKWGNRVSPPAVSLSNRTPPCGEAPGSLPQRGRAREGAALPKTPYVHRGVVRHAHDRLR